jgi:hypothetical protein
MTALDSISIVLILNRNEFCCENYHKLLATNKIVQVMSHAVLGQDQTKFIHH